MYDAQNYLNKIKRLILILPMLLPIFAHSQAVIKGDMVSIRETTIPSACWPGQIRKSSADSKLKSCLPAGTFDEFTLNTATQTLTGKTLTSPTINTPTSDVVNFDDQASTPSNPSANFYKLYFKSDGNLYKLNSSGTETQIDVAAATTPDQSYEISNCSIATSVSGNALTIALKDKSGSDPSGSSICKIGFRSSTAGTGTYVQRSVSAATSVVVSSGSTLGHASARTSYTYVYALDNAGTVELAVSSRYFRPNDRCTSTAEGGAGAADSGTTLYSTTARTSVGCRVLAMLTDSQTTAGTWASNVSQIDLTPFEPIRPRVRYTSDAGNVMTRNSWTTLSWEDLDTDPYNAYSGGTFTAPWDGNYSFATGAEVGGLTGNSITVIRAARGGTVFQHGPECRGGGDPYSATSALCNMSGTVYLSAGDTLAFAFWFDDSTANRNLTTTTGANNTVITWTGF